MSDPTLFQAQRELILRLASQFDEESMLRIPPGRKNNIAWNLGHILTIQQLLTYKLSGQALKIPEAYPSLFGKDTSPEGWEGSVDMEEVRSLLQSTAAEFAADLEGGAFANFQPYTMGTGVAVRDIHEAIAFNFFHEGVHTGIILSIQKDLKR